MGYFEAYRERKEAYNNQFLQLAEDLKQMNLIVTTHSSGLISNLTVYNQDQTQGVRIQFNEVPYRFSFEYDIKPSKEKGSGYTGKEFFGLEGFDFPFTKKDILKAFQPMYIDKRFNKLPYKKTL
jgi:hypothetical protein